MEEEKTLILVDTMNLLFRAYHAMSEVNMTNANGQRTSAVYGYTSMLLTILERKPHYICTAFDLPGRTLRKEAMEEYKANRKPMPEDLKPQIGIVKEVLSALKVPQLSLEGHEADDVMGTIARQGEAMGMKVIIVSGDADLRQVVTDNITVLSPFKGTKEMREWTPQTIREEYGLEPTQIKDLKALMGDSSDNLMGIKGIGKVMATKLVKQYGNITGVLENIESMPESKTKTLLSDGRDELIKTDWMVTINCGLEMQFDPNSSRWNAFDMEEAVDCFDNLKFSSLKRRLWSLVAAGSPVKVMGESVPMQEVEAAALKPEPIRGDQLTLF